MDLLFIFCVSFILYVYMGYPFLLWILTRNVKLNLPAYNYKRSVTILMVVCNEEKNIANKIDNLLSLKYPGNVKIVIVDDHSDDNTCEIIERYNNVVTLIHSPFRAGKANGLNIGMREVDTELVMMVDCRQRIKEDALIHLTSWFDPLSNIGAVSGELMFESLSGEDFSEGMDGYWKYEKFIRKSEAKLNSVPGVTGAIYMIRTELYKELPANTLLDDVQIPMQCCEQGYRVVFDERAIAWDTPSTSPEKEKLRKIRTLSGNYQILFRYPMWVIPTCHPIWWQFFSHKISRLLAPFIGALSICVSLSVYVSDGSLFYLTYTILSLLTLMLLPLTLNFPFIAKIKSIKILSSFLILNWFCVLAAVRFFTVGSAGAWKR